MTKNDLGGATPGSGARPGQCLHQDDWHRVTLFRADPSRPARHAVVCFEAGRDRMNGFEATTPPRFALTLGIDALMVQTARRDWFISPGSAALRAALHAATAHYDDVCLTGFSMGGYGALLYSAACHAGRIMAVSPQYCIDPVVAPYDPARHVKFARIGQPMPLPESAGNRALRGMVLFDPTIAADLEHARRIKAGFPALNLVRLPFGGHPASSVIGEAGGIGLVASMVVQDRINPAKVRQMHRKNRIASNSYRMNLIGAALRRHPAACLPHLVRLAQSAPAKVRLEAGLVLLDHDQDRASELLLDLLEQTPDAPDAWSRRIAQALQRRAP